MEDLFLRKSFDFNNEADTMGIQLWYAFLAIHQRRKFILRIDDDICPLIFDSRAFWLVGNAMLG